MNEESKRRELISTLYVLRVALSYLSQHKDEPKEIQDAYKKKEAEILRTLPLEVPYSAYPEEYKKIQREITKLEDERTALLSEKMKVEEQLDYYANYQKKNTALSFLFDTLKAPVILILVLFLYVFVTLALIAGGIAFPFDRGELFKKILSFYPRYPFGLYKNFRNDLYHNRKAGKRTAEFPRLKTVLSSIEKDLNTINAKIEAKKKEQDKITDRPLDTRYEANKAIREKIKKEASEVKREGEEAYNSLKEKMLNIKAEIAEEVLPVVPQDDWTSLDIIIYFLQEQRAFTMNEALDCYEERRRLGTMPTVMKDSSELVSFSLRGGFESLDRVTFNHFSDVLNRILKPTEKERQEYEEATKIKSDVPAYNLVMESKGVLDYLENKDQNAKE